MIFIDGGYLRETLKEIAANETWDIRALIENLHGHFHLFDALVIGGGLHIPSHIRTYYYDANYDKDDPRFEEVRDDYESNSRYFDSLSDNESVEVKLGQLVASDSGNRQKGVDTLIAIDMLTKAYMNHYDIAILFSGDSDLLPLVKAVKDVSGKRVFGVYFAGHCKDEMKRAFDKELEITDENLSIITGEKEESS